MSTHAIVASGRILAGKLLLADVKGFQRQLAPWRDGDVLVTVEHKDGIRTTAQNALYFAAVVEPIARYTGYTKDEIHELLKVTLLPTMIVQIRETPVAVATSTTRLTSQQFSEYLEACIKWAGETLGLTLTMPEELR